MTMTGYFFNLLFKLFFLVLVLFICNHCYGNGTACYYSMVICHLSSMTDDNYIQTNVSHILPLMHLVEVNQPDGRLQ